MAMNAYCSPKPVDPERMVLLKGETPEQRAETQRKEQRKAILKARKDRKKKLDRRRNAGNYNLGDGM